jgi:hypothetical protein
MNKRKIINREPTPTNIHLTTLEWSGRQQQVVKFFAPVEVGDSMYA